MLEKRNTNENDVLALVLKLIFGLIAVAAIAYSAIEIYKKLKERYTFKICDCDDEYFDDDFCDCECDCDCEIETEDAPEVTEE